MLTVCNRNTRKRCLLISKKTLKTSEQRYVTASTETYLGQFFLEYIPIYNQKLVFSSTFMFRRPVISAIADPYMSFHEKWEIITEIFDP